MATLAKAASLSFCLALLGPACGAMTKKVYRPDELEALLRERTRCSAAGNCQVPFAVDEKYVRQARDAIRPYQTRYGRARTLAGALFSKSYFGLNFEDSATRTANETLRQKSGNCFALASAYIGLARALGLEAYYLDASERVHQLQNGDDFTVRLGHITAATVTEKGIVLLDVMHLFRNVSSWRLMDDLEALAHFYNNRGFELIEAARQDSTPVEWEKVVEVFSIATEIKPDFYRAWNNLGVAYSRSGRPARAEQCYRKAMERDGFVSPVFNLGLLYLARQDYQKAAVYLETAAAMESNNPRIQYNYAVALLGSGHSQQAESIFEKVIQLDRKNNQAHRFLDKIRYYRQNGRLPPPDGSSHPLLEEEEVPPGDI